MTIDHIKQLQHDPKNARKHNPRNVGMLERALNEVGAARSIVIDEDGVVLAGNATMDAAAQAGIERVQVVEADGETLIAVRRRGLTPEQKTKLALYDNRVAELADWDAQLLAELAQETDLSQLFTTDELAALLADVQVEPGGGGDDFDTTPADGPTRTALGDLWQIGPHRLLVGDCTDAANVDRLMDGERAALVVTSPPYNQKLDTFKPSGMQKENPAFVHRMAQAYDDDMPEDEYQERQIELLEMLGRFLAPNASIFYNHKIRYRDKRVVSPMEWLMRVPYAIRQEIIWDRGSSITLNARMFIPADERIYWLRVGDDFVFNDEPDIKAWSTVWEVAAVNEVKASAAFAVEIPMRCIQAASRPDDIVLDPYCGTGTTIIAAHRLARSGYGIERDPRWADVILRRAEAEGLTCERIDG